MRRPKLALVLLALVSPSLASCGEKKPQPAPEPALAATSTVSPAAAAAKPLPEGRSPVPSLAEYAAAREVTVKGSSALKCETKMIREWLRVSCRGKTDTGGTPTGVVVTRGGRSETITFAAGGVTNLITPVLEGTDFEARFSWSDKSHPLEVRWRRGAPKPVIVGEFQGAASPLDGTAPSAAICECHQKLNHTKDCAEAPFSQPDCERTYASTSCEKLLACARGEPAAAPTCPAGTRNAAVTGWCARVCGEGKACGTGTECSHDWGEPPVCL